VHGGRSVYMHGGWVIQGQRLGEGDDQGEDVANTGIRLVREMTSGNDLNQKKKVRNSESVNLQGKKPRGGKKRNREDLWRGQNKRNDRLQWLRAKVV